MPTRFSPESAQTTHDTLRRPSVPFHRRLLNAALIAGVLSQPAAAQDPFCPVPGASGAAPVRPVATLPKKELPEDAEIEGLIPKLGDEEFLMRDRAHQQLTGVVLGKKQGAWERSLQKGIDSKNPEISLRSQEIRTKRMVEDLWAGRRLTFDGATSLASDVIGRINAECDTNILIGDQYGAFDDKEVTIPQGERSFWQAIDEVSVQSKNKVRPHFDSRLPGTVLSMGSPGNFPRAYAGPIRSTLISSRRAFSEEIDFEVGKADVQHTFQFNFQMDWPSNFRLIAYRSQPELVRAKTSEGDLLKATQPSVTGWNNVVGSRQLSMNMRLHPPKTSAKTLEELTLRWGLYAVGDYHTMEMTDLRSGKTVYKDDMEATVLAMDDSVKGRIEMSLLLIRDRVFTEIPESFFLETDFELLDQKGNGYHKQGQTNSTDADGAKPKLTFVGDKDSEPAVLKISYPMIHTKRDVEIPFRDVALPTGRPE